MDELKSVRMREGENVVWLLAAEFSSSVSLIMIVQMQGFPTASACKDLHYSFSPEVLHELIVLMVKNCIPNTNTLVLA